MATRPNSSPAAAKKKSSSKKAATPAVSRALPKSRSVDIRQIDNGWVIRESWTDAKGEYQTRERFSPTEPKVTV